MARTAVNPAPLALLGLALAQVLVLLALVGQWWLAAALLHGAACATLPLMLRMDPPPAGHVGAVLRATAAALPALGPLAAAAGLVAWVCGPGRAAAPAMAWPDDPMEARLAAIATPPPPGTPAMPGGLVLEALADVLRWGTARQKARAVELAARGERPGGDTVLALALRDPDPALRADAEAARPRVAGRLLAQVAAQRAAGGQARSLARLLDRAAHGDMLDPSDATACRMEAVALWRAIARSAPEDSEAQAALGRGLMALGEMQAARAALEAALARGVASPGVLGWLAECLFRMRDFASLDALLTRWRPVLDQSVAANDSVLTPAWRLWLSTSR
jgi:hypothetical protein